MVVSCTDSSVAVHGSISTTSTTFRRQQSDIICVELKVWSYVIFLRYASLDVTVGLLQHAVSGYPTHGKLVEEFYWLRLWVSGNPHYPPISHQYPILVQQQVDSPSILMNQSAVLSVSKQKQRWQPEWVRLFNRKHRKLVSTSCGQSPIICLTIHILRWKDLSRKLPTTRMNGSISDFRCRWCEVLL